MCPALSISIWRGHVNLINLLDRLYERIYEDQALGKLSEEHFLQLGAKYDEEQVAFEYPKSRVRAKVEYPFLLIKRIFHYHKVRYRGVRKNRTHAHTLCALANLYMLRQSGYVGAS